MKLSIKSGNSYDVLIENTLVSDKVMATVLWESLYQKAATGTKPLVLKSQDGLEVKLEP